MLKGIPSILTPDLLKILMEMGHGDTIVIGDGNFPAASCAKRLVRCDGHAVPELLDAILKLFPLDTPAAKPVGVMQVQEQDAPEPEIWQTYRELVAKYEPKLTELNEIERFAFYDRAREAYAVVSTGEKALYANIILKKGVVVE